MLSFSLIFNLRDEVLVDLTDRRGGDGQRAMLLLLAIGTILGLTACYSTSGLPSMMISPPPTLGQGLLPHPWGDPEPTPSPLPVAGSASLRTVLGPANTAITWFGCLLLASVLPHLGAELHLLDRHLHTRALLHHALPTSTITTQRVSTTIIIEPASRTAERC